MLFNSIDFLLFFPVAIGAYYATPYRWRWAVLLALSYGFYAWWRVEYVALIAASTLVDYAAGLAMGRRSTRKARRPFLIVSLTLNLGLLFAFKYFGLFAATANGLLAALGSGAHVGVLDVLLPVGISFYTFQTIAYSVDVYRGEMEPERHLGYFALYVSFWPQLVAGPIERAQGLLPQFRIPHRFDAAMAADGLKLMAWGFFLKLVVADRVARVGFLLVTNPEDLHGLSIATALYLGGFFIYADFAGYSLIAIGAAHVMGIRLMTNFRQPYLAPSMAELWRRWHISLTTWFKDYLYVPLRAGWLGLSAPAAIVVVFAVTGLWHGAAWRFLAWGLAMGVYLIVERLTLAPRDRLWAGATRRLVRRGPQPMAAGLSTSLDGLRTGLGVFWTYTVWVIGALAFFVTDFDDAATLLRNVGQPSAGLREEIFVFLGNSSYEFMLGVAAVAVVVAVDVLERREPVLDRIARWPWGARSALYATVVLAILLLGELGEREFVYFQF